MSMKQLGGEVPMSMFNIDPRAHVLFWLWSNPSARRPKVQTMYAMFVKHVHDSMAESEIESVWSYFIAIKNYMNTRFMQRIGTEPDKTFLDRVTEAY
ncbi:hypothetical protein [Paraburkholderia bannensis]|uniref:hypothetical protein n=1 Tax=Paraburkholderia bannensis TaxID=765414 RepID=UPI002AB31ECB|nr:hypothetical protein [Paraburkholderia bannensis]